MKFSEKWLREWVNPDLTTQELVDQLTMVGHETDSFGPVAGDFSGVIVAEILNITKHPDADRLNVCSVNAGDAEPLQVVCGGKNVRNGLKVALAKIGAILPGDFKIKRSKLRGVESFGMICSEVELGLADSSDGIMELMDDAPVGKDIREYLQLDDTYIDLDLTPNRGDCLSIYGLAREISAVTKTKYKPHHFNVIAAQSEKKFKVNVTAKQACPRYVGRVINNINPQAQSPLWMQEYLRRSGLRPIHPVVDVTNFVMLELGQPLHAFDLKQLSENIEVRFANPNEKMTLLNDQEVSLSEDTLLITDAKRPLAIAGVMGGLDSGVTEATTDIFLESAFFAPEIIAGKARSYGLHTDSSHRFERGVDPYLQIKAIERTTELLLAIVGGVPGPVCETVADDFIPQEKIIELSKTKINKVIGKEFSTEDVREIFQRLHMDVDENETQWRVKVPTYRFDLNIDVDLVEEVARIYGYQNIPTNLPKIALQPQQNSATTIALSELHKRLLSLGYQEAIVYSFIEPKLQAMFEPELKAYELANPLSADMAVMRTSLLPGLVNTVLYNQNRQQERIRLFEIGQRFREINHQLVAQNVIAGVICGSVYPEQWALQQRNIDYYDLKGDVEALLSLTGQLQQFSFVNCDYSALHPGQSAAVLFADETVGFIGRLHPKIEKELGLKGPIFVFELCLQAISNAIIPTYAALSKFPAIRRDLAIIVNKSINAQDVVSAVYSIDHELLRNVQIFDVYQGQGIDPDKKSLALALTLQHQTRTLVDGEVIELTENVVKLLETKFQAVLRD